jgi:ribonuclease BN (tRNA processing enzyme)
MEQSRRKFLIGSAGFAAWCGLAVKGARLSQDKKRTRIILLGTKGGPSVRTSGRSNPSTLILINDVPYIIDCGYGTSRRLLEAGVTLDRLRYIFVTHLHSDHSIEFGTLFYNAWIAGLSGRVDAYGPIGLRNMAQGFFNYQKFDIDTRVADEGRPHPRSLIAVHEFRRPGLVMHNDDVKVTSGRVRHPPITQAYAYRFDAKDRSVVVSGDTAYAPELAEFAKGADVLIHEVMYLPGVDALLKRAAHNAKRLLEHLIASHTQPEEVGKIAAQAGVKTLVLSHLVPGDDSSITDEQWAEGARKHFKGRIIVGKDLMEI